MVRPVSTVGNASEVSRIDLAASCVMAAAGRVALRRTGVSGWVRRNVESRRDDRIFRSGTSHFGFVDIV